MRHKTVRTRPGSVPLFDALRFLVVVTFIAVVTWVIVGPIRNSELLTRIAIAVVNALALFTAIDRFVEAKLDRRGTDVA